MGGEPIPNPHQPELRRSEGTGIPQDRRTALRGTRHSLQRGLRRGRGARKPTGQERIPQDARIGRWACDHRRAGPGPRDVVEADTDVRDGRSRWFFDAQSEHPRPPFGGDRLRGHRASATGLRQLLDFTLVGTVWARGIAAPAVARRSAARHQAPWTAREARAVRRVPGSRCREGLSRAPRCESPDTARREGVARRFGGTLRSS